MLSWTLRKLTSKNERVAFKAAKKLASMPDPPIAEVMSTLRAHPGIQEKVIYLLKLAGQNKKDIWEPLLLSLGDDLEYVRVTAAHVLYLVPGARRQDALRLALKDDCDAVSTYAACALANMGHTDDDVILALVRGCTCSDRHAKDCARSALKTQVGKKAIPHLLRAKEASRTWGLYEVLITLIDPTIAIKGVNDISFSPHPEAYPNKKLTIDKARHFANNCVRLAQAFVSVVDPDVVLRFYVDEELRNARCVFGSASDHKHLLARGSVEDFLDSLNSDSRLNQPLPDWLLHDLVRERVRWISQ